MPIPKPTKNESKNDFINRCISKLTEMNEGKDNTQRVAMCQTQWRNRNKDDQDQPEIPTTSNNPGTIAGHYEEVPQLPEGFEKPKPMLEILEDELKLP